MALQAHPEQSDTAIADHCGVSREYVLRSRPQGVIKSHPDVRTGVDSRVKLLHLKSARASTESNIPPILHPLAGYCRFFGGDFLGSPFSSPVRSRSPFARLPRGLASHSPLAYGCCAPLPFSLFWVGYFSAAGRWWGYWRGRAKKFRLSSRKGIQRSA